MITNMYYIKVHIQDGLVDTKEVPRGGKSKYIQIIPKKLKRKKMSKGQTMIYKTLHRKLKIK